MLFFRLLAMALAFAPYAAVAQHSSVSQAACRWGDALASTEFMWELCPDLEHTSLADDMLRVFENHSSFKRCFAAGIERMAKLEPKTDDERRLYCAWLLKGDGNGQPVVRRR